jgi:riboflavin biosynthesis pyrimidine reductase
MSSRLLRLQPAPHAEHDLHGLYLAHELHRLGAPGRPLVYGNFLTSLDGRIAVTNPVTRESAVPEHMSSDNDLRLLLELQAQADCLITHGGYLRSLAAGRLGNVLQVGVQAGAEDLAEWRREQGLEPQPDIVVASASLDFPIPQPLQELGQRIIIATGADADPARVDTWERRGMEVIVAGDSSMVDGDALVSILARRRYQSLYLLAGPLMLATMIHSGRLSRLYLTITHQIIGGTDFTTLYHGPQLRLAGRLDLRSLYADSVAATGSGQWYAMFEPRGA